MARDDGSVWCSDVGVFAGEGLKRVVDYMVGEVEEFLETLLSTGSQVLMNNFAQGVVIDFGGGGRCGT